LTTVSEDRAYRGMELPAGATPGAWHDLRQGWAWWQYWTVLGWNDIRQRYRRSLLGPLWLTLSLGATIAGIGLLYATVLNVPFIRYLPHLGLGLVFWTFFSGLVTDGCHVFSSSAPLITQARIPYLAYVFRSVMRNSLVLLHNMALYLLMLPLLWPNLGWPVLLFIPGLLLVMVSAVWVTLLLGMLCARFRDAGPIIANLLQLAFFMTPILWKPELLSGHDAVLMANPFFHFLELLRAPLMGVVPAAEVWLVAVGLTLGGGLLTLAIYARQRGRIVYWM